MNIAEYSIKNKVISWLFIVILAIGGVTSFLELGRLEDPAFTIKDAMIVATYPGATSKEVEEELTYPLEKEIRKLPYIDRITSTSSNGMSQIMVSMKMDYGPDELPQIWDEMRRKINDLQPTLPQGVQSLQIIDDFGDVYGVMLMLTGDDYDYVELKRYADHLRREIELVDGVGKVDIAGDQQEMLFVEISLDRLASLNLDMNVVSGLLNQQNNVVSAGEVMVNGESLVIRPSGTLNTVQALENLIIHGRDTGNLIRLKDVATITRGIQEKPGNMILFNGKKAINIGISFASGVNVVEVGERLNAELSSLESIKPAGLDMSYFYNQAQEVDDSVKAFVVSLAEAVAIVIIVLLFTMGLRSGVIIGVVLLLTVFGTFILMNYNNIELHRISLGALIIALGMLVDNAIVVVEGILVGLKKGRTKVQAAVDIVKQTQWPLLGATVIAITAFAPIGLSQDATGEFMGSLFWVLCFSLFLSWVTAITLTPFLADLLLKEEEKDTNGEDEDPYKGWLFVVFGALLKFSLRFRWMTVAAMVALLVGAVIAFGNVKQQFFPPSNTPMFYVDMWMPEGTDIRQTIKQAEKVESYIRQQDDIDFVSVSIGQGLQRFALTYQPEKSYEAYAQFQVRTTDRDNMFKLLHKLDDNLAKTFDEPTFQFKLMEFGPSPASKIEARITGPDPKVLRELAVQVEDILHTDPGARNIRHDWRERTKELVPVFNESKARRLGISKEDLSSTLQMAFGGSTFGVLRDGTHTLPIMMRLPEAERVDFESLQNVKIWSPSLQTYIPVDQIIDGVELDWSEPLNQRRDRKRTLTVLADHDVLSDDTAASLFARVQPKVMALHIPEGYEITWGGEYESSKDAQEGLFGSLPMGYLLMFIITILLFNSIKKPLVIWFTVPLSIIGVAFGLLTTNMPFSFTAFLGLLSLSGMILKNGIVLLDQINLELESGKDPYLAIVDSAISRVRPVSMAALTTILGMIPLVFDAFFGSMAITIMAGLGFATVLTLIVVPVMFAILFRIKPTTA
ncbi:TPA: multidrug efflux RND transporter permease subunit VmeV [Vibrio parahaemolyticus]|uniref:multidrug efflux RND transporter permease subunit VmeV n=1 Tax=Vibrio parahaemolyticus TaxID=670 RepID=UPI00079FFBDA|nr:multidrug efflux RND transporter permease subunit VmeV [Vibrio parahaemolyticus]EGQ8524983.1 multidrug efflux RND transporter permease subunit VmeV [Vibrio parahaemolyticus]EGQ9208980.1 multidrug efflux RND transporter permease subunit VmeV [Vibrio parahaemolyticus]EGQ9787464.1 multidrug efflux RND transporter permease subunit VmeV [Vibrio parahaemolyticus]EGQ9924119.1 multidrug efflux RND transporter permease subunit VmeV [Vibrio parahaemolyticus]EGR0118528.1 multidrug efflux RND transport